MATDVMLLFVGIFQGYLTAESRTGLLLTMVQRVSKKTLKKGYLRLQTLWSLFVKIPLGLPSHKIPFESYCLQYYKGYYGKPLKRYLHSQALSSNINEVIWAVLNPLLFFYQKISHAPKAPKPQKASKVQKAQKHNHAKVQNATSEQK